MALYPDVQRAAHAEIDAVLGDSRLPDFCDEEKLPYIGAVLKEVFRWHPVAPLGGCRQPESYMDLTLAELGIPHRVTKGDIYEGYFIPAGSMVIGNGWSALFLDASTITLNSNTFFYLRAMLHDPDTFPEPSRFNPERWLAPGAPAFPDAAFGFGRRECPGRFMARDSVWAAITGVLAAFEISPVEDDPPKELYTSGIVACVVLSWDFALRLYMNCSSYPEPFKCQVRSRSEAFTALVCATANES